MMNRNANRPDRGSETRRAVDFEMHTTGVPLPMHLCEMALDSREGR